MKRTFSGRAYKFLLTHDFDIRRHNHPVAAVANPDAVRTDEQTEAEVAKGYTMTQFCDKMIEVFLHEKPQSKDWRKILVFRDEWNKYRQSFYNRLQVRADTEKDATIKQRLVSLARKIRKVTCFRF